MSDRSNGMIISFPSRSSVFAMQEGLRKDGVSSRIISTPAVAKMACGLSLEIEGKNYQKSLAVAKRLGLRVSAVFVVGNIGNRRSYVRVQNLQ